MGKTIDDFQEEELSTYWVEIEMEG